MTNNNKIIFLLPVIILLSLCASATAQHVPEITIGAKYIEGNVVSTYGKDYVLTPELGVGINFNEKWYTGITSYFYNENGIHNEEEWASKFTSLEIEFRRSFPIKQIPKIVPYITIKPGIMIWHYTTTENEEIIKGNSTLISTSLSAGIYYKVSQNFKVTASYGLCRTTNKEALFNLSFAGFSTILDAGISYVF
jgi:hypothetical protein